MPRLESPDEADWDQVARELRKISRGHDLASALDLRDRLTSLVQDYAPKAATIDERLLRRDVHRHLDSTLRRHQQGWQQLRRLHVTAVSTVRDHVGLGDRRARIDRSEAELDLWNAIESSNAVVVYGESGVGKSALVVTSVASRERESPGDVQAVILNLRELPETTVALENYLHSDLASLLGEHSAPTSVLVIDGADASSENKLHQLRHLIDAAHATKTKVVAVGTVEIRKTLIDILAEAHVDNITEFPVEALTDAQIDTLVADFPELTELAEDSRSRELLRRPVVSDLLVRAERQNLPFSDADAMTQIWSELVRRDGKPARGTPQSRELALLRLAELSLHGGNALEVLSTIEPTALEGLRQDGLLRTRSDDPFSIGPGFSHDEIRRYALARLMLSAPAPATKLVEAGVPRWTLSAARLACQVWLSAPGANNNPMRGRFARLQDDFDQIADTASGKRWGDVPGEALLTLSDPASAVNDAWPTLRANGNAGLRRISRLVVQRLVDKRGLVRISAIEPIIDRLLHDEMVWEADEYIQIPVRKWLQSLIGSAAPVGHPLRDRLRSTLVTSCAEADARQGAKWEAAKAARAVQQTASAQPDPTPDDRQRRIARTLAGDQRRRRRPRQTLSYESTNETIVAMFALLGADLGEDGERFLRRVAEESPGHLWPALETAWADIALAQHGGELLANLTEAYYIDSDGTSSYHDYGIRNHRDYSFVPQAAWYYGPFHVMVRVDPVRGIQVLNRMLNHAASRRCLSLGSHGAWSAPAAEVPNEYRISMDVAGMRREYVGDSEVWMWYRGGLAVGPRPCMSGLMALERVCDELIDEGWPLPTLIALLLNDCENLAMVALAVGLVVRHLEIADKSIDPFLEEPSVWAHEFARTQKEQLGSVAPSDGLVAPDRRSWSLSDVAMRLVIVAEDERAEELAAVGRSLLDRARRKAQEASAPQPIDEDGLALVRAWACSLDRSTYSFDETPQGTYITTTPPQDVIAVIRENAADAPAHLASAKLTVKYYIDPRNGVRHESTAEDLTTDLAVARDLIERPPAVMYGDELDGPTLVVAAALRAHVLGGIELAKYDIDFAVRTVMSIATGELLTQHDDYVDAYFEQGAERSAAYVLPLLLLP